MLGRTDSRARLLVLFGMIAMLAGGLVLRLAYWQVAQRPELVEAAQQNGTIRDVRPAIRGTIYDRTGRVVLAQTIFRDRLIASPAELSDAERTAVAARLVEIMGLAGDAASALRDAMNQDSHWVVLATNIDAETSKQIRQGLADGSLAALLLEPQAVRVYPQGGGAPHTSLAAHVLGFVNADGKGQYGVEQAYDAQLAGKPEIDLIDPSLPLDQATRVIQKGIPGQDIRLTIDASLQLSLEQEVFAAWAADKAKNVSAVAMDPKTGAILADASYPSFDGNAYAEIANTNPSLFMDPVISKIYEPGSVFKMLLASSALKSGAVTLDTKINDFGVMRLPSGAEVADANRQSMGWMKFADIVAWSRNVGVTQAAFRLGPDVSSAAKALYSTWRSYGIGSNTGVDMAGEVGGIVRDPASTEWRDIDLANASFGQGVAVTPLQVLRAYTCMMNGGTLVTPYVSQSAADAARASAVHGVIDQALADKLTGLMNHVVTSVPSYAQGTLIPGYLVGGKTGTAQIWDPTANDGAGDWKRDIYNFSFYGYVGQNSPQVAIGVVIDEGVPLVVRQGVLILGEESYQLFRRAAWDAITALAIQPQSAAQPSSSASSGSSGGTSSQPSPSR